MKRHTNLWPRLTSFSNLVRAAEKASRGKRNKPNVARFHYDLENQVCRLQDELHGKIYAPGSYRTAINIHNFNDEAVGFRKKAVLAVREIDFPTSGPIPIGGPVDERLRADEAMEVDCQDICLLFDDLCILPDFMKGFVVIKVPGPPRSTKSALPTQLDVVGVYTLKNVEETFRSPL